MSSMLDHMTRGYVTAALWADLRREDRPDESGSDDATYLVTRVDRDSMMLARNTVLHFIVDNYRDLMQYAEERAYDPSQDTIWGYAGHDLWLSAGGHGAGFWDRGLGELGDRLHKGARAAPESAAPYVTVTEGDEIDTIAFEGMDESYANGWEDRARKMGREAGTAAGAWAADGNSSREWLSAMLDGLEEGDPEIIDRLPRRPDLSGMMADDPTPQSLAREIVGDALLAVDDQEIVGELEEALTEAWEKGVEETYMDSCQSTIRNYLSEDA